jgi:uncharacterized protein (TIGR00369 family)
MEHTIKKKQHISKNCLVCGVDNRFGLHTRFYETDDNEVIAVFRSRDEHQSYPGIVHGGISAALLDEAIGRAIMVHYGRDAFGVTLDLQVKYRKPVPLGETLKAVARITSDKGRMFEGTGELYLADGSVAVSARGKYMKRDLDQFSDQGFATDQWFEPDGESPEKISI